MLEVLGTLRPLRNRRLYWVARALQNGQSVRVSATVFLFAVFVPWIAIGVISAFRGQ
jgi:hypothetical protein